MSVDSLDCHETCAIWEACKLRLSEVKMWLDSMLPVAHHWGGWTLVTCGLYKGFLFSWEVCGSICSTFTCFFPILTAHLRMVFWEWVYVSSKNCLTWSSAFAIIALRVYNSKMKVICCVYKKIRKFLLKNVQSLLFPVPCHWFSRTMTKKISIILWETLRLIISSVSNYGLN